MEEYSTDAVEFDVQMDTGVLYDYFLYHTYRSPIGILGTVMGILLIANYCRTYVLSYLIFGVIVLLYLPVTLYLSSKKQMLLVESYKSPIHYRISDEGIEITQGEVSQGHKWDVVVKASGSARSIFIYTGKNVATIFPRKAMGEKTNAVIAMISRCVEPSRVKIRF